MDEDECSPRQTSMELIDNLRHNLTKEKRLYSIAGLVKNYLPDFKNLENELLHVLLPSTSQLLNEILDHNTTLLMSDIILETEIFKIKENIVFCVELLAAIDLLMSFLLFKECFEFSSVQSVPTSITCMIYNVFQHCHKCNDLYYKSDCNLTDEILMVFKKGKEINEKLLKFINGRIYSNPLLENEKEIIIKVLDNLCGICDIVSEMNFVTLVDTWRCYISLTKKYAKELEYDIHFTKVLTIISKDVLTKMSKIEDKNVPEKEAENVAKICGFLVKIVSNVIEICWDSCRNSPKTLFDFFTTIYSFTGKHTILIQSYIFDPLEEMFLQLMHTLNVYILEVPFESNVGLFVIINTILTKLTLSEYSFKILHFLSLLMKSLQKDNQSPTIFNFFSNNEIVYNELLIKFAGTILSNNMNEFLAIEEFLILKVTLGSTWEAQFATDLYLLLLRHMPPTMSYNVLKHLIDEIKMYVYVPIICFNKATKLLLLMSKVYEQLTPGLQVKILERYSPESNFQIWYILSFKCIPNSKIFLRNAVSKKIGYIFENINSDEGCGEDVLNAIYATDAMLREADNDILIQLKGYLYYLWNFEYSENIAINKNLLTFLLSTLKSMIKSMVHFLDEEEAITILNKLHVSLQIEPYIKLILSQILTSAMSQRTAENCLQEHAFFHLHNVTNLPLKLFTIKNGIKEFGERLSPNKNNKNIDKKNVIDINLKIKSRMDLSKKSDTKNNICNVEEPQPFVGDEVVDEILLRLKKDTAALRKFSIAGKLTPQNSKKIVAVLNQLQQLL